MAILSLIALLAVSRSLSRSALIASIISRVVITADCCLLSLVSRSLIVRSKCLVVSTICPSPFRFVTVAYNRHWCSALYVRLLSLPISAYCVPFGCASFERSKCCLLSSGEDVSVSFSCHCLDTVYTGCHHGALTPIAGGLCNSRECPSRK